MTREEVLSRFCALSAMVMREHFAYKEPADCFCGQGVTDPERIMWQGFFTMQGDGDYRFSEKVIGFIEDAVRARLQDRQACNKATLA